MVYYTELFTPLQTIGDNKTYMLHYTQLLLHCDPCGHPRDQLQSCYYYFLCTLFISLFILKILVTRNCKIPQLETRSQKAKFVASGHGTSGSSSLLLPTCAVPPNFFFFLFLWRVSKKGVSNHGTNLGFTSASLMEGFTVGVPNSWHVPRFYLPNWLMWFDSLPL